ncbi:MAG: nuclear transport factor 2 family protein [Solirubrobacterales bacterium]
MEVTTRSEPFGDDLKAIELVVGLLTSARERSLDDVARYIHPEMHTVGVPGLAPGRSHESREEFLETFTDSADQGVRVEPDVIQIRVLAPDLAMASGRVRVSGPAGTDVVPAWFVYTIRDGLIDSLSTFLSWGTAAEFIKTRTEP